MVLVVGDRNHPPRVEKTVVAILLRKPVRNKNYQGRIDPPNQPLERGAKSPPVVLVTIESLLPNSQGIQDKHHPDPKIDETNVVNHP